MILDVDLKILFLSYYFEPDLSAGSFRNTALSTELGNKIDESSSIDVITTAPSRYNSYIVPADKVQVNNNIRIYRILPTAHKGGMIDQSFSFIFYAIHVFKVTKNQDYDIVYASSSRLMTAVIGAILARKKGAPLYLDIRDIFVDTIKDVLSPRLAFLLKPFFSIVEKFAFNTAAKINLVSYGFSDYFENRYPNKKLSFFSNGIDQEFVLSQPKESYRSDSEQLVVVYAGNFGEGQGLHFIIPTLAKHFEGIMQFKLYGDGGRIGELKKSLKDNDVNNVQILSPVSRKKLIDIYRDADILFLHLNSHEAFLKVLPSKLFEYASTGKPIWAGLSGFSKKFLNDYVDNSVVFEPCNVDEAIDAFNHLVLETRPRNEFVENFSRIKIMSNMASDILDII